MPFREAFKKKITQIVKQSLQIGGSCKKIPTKNYCKQCFQRVKRGDYTLKILPKVGHGPCWGPYSPLICFLALTSYKRSIFLDNRGKKCVSLLPIILSLFPYYASRQGGQKIYQYSLSKYSLTVSMVGGSEGIGTISLSR